MVILYSIFELHEWQISRCLVQIKCLLDVLFLLSFLLEPFIVILFFNLHFDRHVVPDESLLRLFLVPFGASLIILDVFFNVHINLSKKFIK